MRRIAVFGPSELYNKDNEEEIFLLGHLLWSSCYRVVCGGGSGVMKEVCRGFFDTEK